MQLLTEVSGLLASITGLLLWLPQGLRVWRDRDVPDRLVGISVPTQVLSLAGNVLWLLHAIGIGSFWLGAPSVVNVPIAIMTIVVVRRAAPASALEQAGPFLDGPPTAATDPDGLVLAS